MLTQSIGDELHILACPNTHISQARIILLQNITQICPQFNSLTSTQQLTYIMKAHDNALLRLTGLFLAEVFKIYKTG